MKCIIIFGLFLVLTVPVCAAPWGVSDELPSQKAPGTTSLKDLVADSFLPQLLARQEPLRYCIDGTDDMDYYDQIFRQTYQKWFSKTAQFIRRSNRAEEFEDILPFLEKPLLLQRQNCGHDDFREYLLGNAARYGEGKIPYAAQDEQLRVSFLAPDDLINTCDADAAGCAFSDNVKVKGASVFAPQGSDSSTLLHELGHTLRMGEGYESGQTSNSPLYGTGMRKQAGAMSSARNGKGSDFSCDDADAMVVFTDTISLPGKPARTGLRARRFQSFCQDDPIIYFDGLVQGRRNLRAISDNRVYQAEYYRNGRLKRMKVYSAKDADLSQSFDLFRKYRFTQDNGAEHRLEDGRIFLVDVFAEENRAQIVSLKGNKIFGRTDLTYYDDDFVFARTNLAVAYDKQLIKEQSLYAVNKDRINTRTLVFQKEDTEARNVSYHEVNLFEDDVMSLYIYEPATALTTMALLEKTSNNLYLLSVYYQLYDEPLVQLTYVTNGLSLSQAGSVEQSTADYLRKELRSSTEVLSNILSTYHGVSLGMASSMPSVDMMLSEKYVLSIFQTALQEKQNAQQAYKMHLQNKHFIRAPFTGEQTDPRQSVMQQMTPQYNAAGTTGTRSAVQGKKKSLSGNKSKKKKKKKGTSSGKKKATAQQ